MRAQNICSEHTAKVELQYILNTLRENVYPDKSVRKTMFLNKVIEPWQTLKKRNISFHVDGAPEWIMRALNSAFPASTLQCYHFKWKTKREYLSWPILCLCIHSSSFVAWHMKTELPVACPVEHIHTSFREEDTVRFLVRYCSSDQLWT